MKTHTVTSEPPLVNNQNQTADCGAEIEQAEILGVWDGLEPGNTLMPISTVLLCPKCLTAVLSSREDRPRYLYAIAKRLEREGGDE